MSILRKACLGMEQVTSRLKGARVVARVDWNVPFKEGKIKDPARVKETVPTLNHLSEHAHSVVLLAHLGRPDGQAKPEFSFKPLLSQFEQIVGRPITFLPDCVSDDTLQQVANPKKGQIFLCQNVRFHLEEQGSVKDASGKKIKADPAKVQEFRNRLTRLGNFYVNDAFGAAHRGHSSIQGVKHDVRVAGLLMKKELEYFGRVMEKPTRPLTFIMGGAKINDKLKLINRVLEIADNLVIGGGMSYTFQKHKGLSIGTSLFDKEGFDKLTEIYQKAKERNVQIHLPLDVRAALNPGCTGDQVKLFNYEKDKGIAEGLEGFDIGPETVEYFKGVLSKSKTIIWNGPCGFFEKEEFRKGSAALVNHVADLTTKGALSVIGGGDTASLVKLVPGAEAKISHVSTGGGATLQLLQGNRMPGVESLSNVEELK